MNRIISTVIGFIRDPVRSFQEVRDIEWTESLKYYALLLVFNSLFFALSDPVWNNNITSYFTLFILFYIAMIIYLIIYGLILHISVRIMRSDKKITSTFKIVAYGSTPSLLFGWIPVIGIITGIWSIILMILGIREIHDVSEGKAIIAIVISYILLFILAIVVFFGIYRPLQLGLMAIS